MESRNMVPSFCFAGSARSGIIRIPAFTRQIPTPMGTIISGSRISLHPR